MEESCQCSSYRLHIFVSLQQYLVMATLAKCWSHTVVKLPVSIIEQLILAKTIPRWFPSSLFVSSLSSPSSVPLCHVLEQQLHHHFRQANEILFEQQWKEVYVLQWDVSQERVRVLTNSNRDLLPSRRWMVMPFIGQLDFRSQMPRLSLGSTRLDSSRN